MHWEGKSSERVSYQDHYQTIEAMRPMSKLANTTGKLQKSTEQLGNKLTFRSGVHLNVP
jgi:hypothetical protein